ncbi:hypothetical protein P3S67_009322 [Capsicum chacoense]
MDETKSHKIENLKEENLRLRQQMMKMYQAWASGLPPPQFPTFDPANTLSLPPKLQSQFPTMVDAPQHAFESIPCQMHLNTSTTLSLAPQHKSTTFTAPHTFCVFVAQPSTKTFTLAINPTIVLPQSTSESAFNTRDNHCYTLEPTVKLSGPPKFLTKKPCMLEEPEKMVGKVKSVENDMKSSLGLVGYEDLGGQNDSVKHLGRYCNQSRETEGKKKENSYIVMPGIKQSLGGLTHQHYQPQSLAYISNPLIHMQQGSSFQNPRSSIPFPQYPLNNAQLYAHPFSYPQWNAPVPQHRPRPPQIYQGASKSKFHPRPEFTKRRKEKYNFTPIGESYASLFHRLVQQGMITPLLNHIQEVLILMYDVHIILIFRVTVLKIVVL